MSHIQGSKPDNQLKVGHATGLLVLLLVIMCTACVVLPRLYIHHIMQKMIDKVTNFPLPPGSSLKKVESEISENNGNGDYCVFTVREYVTTTSTKAQVDNIYADAKLDGFKEFLYENYFDVSFPALNPDGGGLDYVVEAAIMTDRYFDVGCK